MTLQELLQQYSLPIAIAIYALFESIKLLLRKSNATVQRTETEIKQDETILNSFVEFNAERKSLQESNNRIQAEYLEIRVNMAREEGRREQLEKNIAQKQDEWQTERLSFNEKFHNMEARILELEKTQRANVARIHELETQIEILNQRIADKDGEINTLKALVAKLEAEKAELIKANAELKEQVTQHSLRAESLSEIVDKINKIDEAAAKATPTTITDATQAIPDMRDVDDTIHPLPENTEDNAA